MVACCALWLGTFYNEIYAQDQNTVLVKGNPPLTEGMMVKVIALLQWSLDVRFTNEQGAEIAKGIMSYWQENKRSEIESMTEIMNVADGLMKASEAERAKAKEIIRANLLKSLEADTGDRLSRVVLEAYRSARQSTTVDAGRSSLTGSGRTGNDGLPGIYVGTRNFASSINTVQLDYVTFLPGGSVLWSLPAEGLRNFDARTAQRTYPDEWGTYKVAGNEIHVSIGSGLKYIFQIDGGQLKLQPHSGSSSVRTYSRLATGDGIKLNGAYRRSESEPSIVFYEDGRFRDEGFMRNFGTMGRPDGSTYQSDGRGGSGTYLIGQNTLELRYSDGRVQRFAFTALPTDVARHPVRSFRLNYETMVLQ
jgi:hypothetical protein